MDATAGGRDGLGEPEQALGGDDVEEAVAAAEEGSPAEGDHPVPGTVQPGESRAERMRDVVDGDA